MDNWIEFVGGDLMTIFIQVILRFWSHYTRPPEWLLAATICRRLNLLAPLFVTGHNVNFPVMR